MRCDSKLSSAVFASGKYLTGKTLFLSHRKFTFPPGIERKVEEKTVKQKGHIFYSAIFFLYNIFSN